MTWDVIVIGAGAAGILAATRAAERGLKVLLLEKNRKPGVKILMSGGTRCNLTQATDRAGILAAFRDQGPFLRNALALFGPEDAVRLVEDEGVPTKREPTGKIFPASDRAADILDAFLRRLQRSGATMAAQHPVTNIVAQEASFLVTTPTEDYSGKTLIVTTGGQSYPGCGTCGDGYVWAARMGHTCVSPQPALVPILSETPWVRELQGLTMEKIRLRLLLADSARIDEVPEAGLVHRALSRKNKGKTLEWQGSTWHLLDQREGSTLFTHFGLSGPAVLDISQLIPRFQIPTQLRLEFDFIPELETDMLESQLDSLLCDQGGKQVLSVVTELLPRRLAERLLALSNVNPEQRASEISRETRRRLLGLMKQTVIPIHGTLGFKKAEVTSGGIRLDEINPRTMESRCVKNLYFAGEILDIDGPIGGYNFQAAFSTGWLAGSHVC